MSLTLFCFYFPQTSGSASLSCKLHLGLNEWQNLQERKLTFQFIINKQIKYNCFVNITISLALDRVFSLLWFILTQLLFISFFLVPGLNMVQIFCLGTCIHRSIELTFWWCWYELGELRIYLNVSSTLWVTPSHHSTLLNITWQITERVFSILPFPSSLSELPTVYVRHLRCNKETGAIMCVSWCLIRYFYNANNIFSQWIYNMEGKNYLTFQEVSK